MDSQSRKIPQSARHHQGFGPDMLAGRRGNDQLGNGGVGKQTLADALCIPPPLHVLMIKSIWATGFGFVETLVASKGEAVSAAFSAPGEREMSV